MVGQGQLAGNGGIKIQGRYELQVLNSPGISDMTAGVGAKNEAGSIYEFLGPSRKVSFGSGVWQNFDIWFQAAKWENQRKISNARMTVYWNGFLVHDDVEVMKQTGASPQETPGPHEVVLQAHQLDSEGRVGYRNVWVVRDPFSKGIFPPK